MRRALPILLLPSFLGQLSCGSTPASDPAPAPAVHAVLDTSSLDALWTLHAFLSRNESPPQSCWDTLFATASLQYVAHNQATRDRMQRCIAAALQPAADATRESMRQESRRDAAAMDRFVRAVESRPAIDALVNDLGEGGMLTRAMQMVQEHLPAGTVDPNDPPVLRLAVFAQEAYARNHEVILDALLALDLGDSLRLVVAHELHHCYYEQLRTCSSLPDSDPLERILHTLHQLHLEGVADRIDKFQHPIRDIPGFPPTYAELYNGHYLETPDTIAAFDRLLARIQQEPDNTAELAREAWSLFHFGAHPEGLFVAQRIVDVYGPNSLRADVGDPFAFFRRYRQACVELGEPDPLSPASQQLLESLEARVCRRESRSR